MNNEVFTDYPAPGDMVDGYDYTGPITFHPKYGHLASGRFPADCIESCAASGDCTEAVEYWQSRLNFNPPRDLMERYLKEYGAWDDLQTASDDTLAQRILWIACCDIREQGEWSGLNH